MSSLNSNNKENLDGQAKPSAALSFRERLEQQLKKAKELQQQAQMDLEVTKKDSVKKDEPAVAPSTASQIASGNPSAKTTAPTTSSFTSSFSSRFSSILQRDPTKTFGTTATTPSSSSSISQIGTTNNTTGQSETTSTTATTTATSASLSSSILSKDGENKFSSISARLGQLRESLNPTLSASSIRPSTTTTNFSTSSYIRDTKSEIKDTTSTSESKPEFKSTFLNSFQRQKEASLAQKKEENQDCIIVEEKSTLKPKQAEVEMCIEIEANPKDLSKTLNTSSLSKSDIKPFQSSLSLATKGSDYSTTTPIKQTSFSSTLGNSQVKEDSSSSKLNSYISNSNSRVFTSSYFANRSSILNSNSSISTQQQSSITESAVKRDSSLLSSSQISTQANLQSVESRSTQDISKSEEQQAKSIIKEIQIAPPNPSEIRVEQPQQKKEISPHKEPSEILKMIDNLPSSSESDLSQNNSQQNSQQQADDILINEQEPKDTEIIPQIVEVQEQLPQVSSEVKPSNNNKENNNISNQELTTIADNDLSHNKTMEIEDTQQNQIQENKDKIEETTIDEKIQDNQPVVDTQVASENKQEDVKIVVEENANIQPELQDIKNLQNNEKEEIVPSHTTHTAHMEIEPEAQKEENKEKEKESASKINQTESIITEEQVSVQQSNEIVIQETESESKTEEKGLINLNSEQNCGQTINHTSGISENKIEVEAITKQYEEIQVLSNNTEVIDSKVTKSETPQKLNEVQQEQDLQNQSEQQNTNETTFNHELLNEQVKEQSIDEQPLQSKIQEEVEQKQVVDEHIIINSQRQENTQPEKNHSEAIQVVSNENTLSEKKSLEKISQILDQFEQMEQESDGNSENEDQAQVPQESNLNTLESTNSAQHATQQIQPTTIDYQSPQKIEQKTVTEEVKPIHNVEIQKGETNIGKIEKESVEKQNLPESDQNKSVEKLLNSNKSSLSKDKSLSSIISQIEECEKMDEEEDYENSQNKELENVLLPIQEGKEEQEVQVISTQENNEQLQEEKVVESHEQETLIQSEVTLKENEQTDIVNTLELVQNNGVETIDNKNEQIQQALNDNQTIVQQVNIAENIEEQKSSTLVEDKTEIELEQNQKIPIQPNDNHTIQQQEKEEIQNVTVDQENQVNNKIEESLQISDQKTIEEQTKESQIKLALTQIVDDSSSSSQSSQNNSQESPKNEGMIQEQPVELEEPTQEPEPAQEEKMDEEEQREEKVTEDILKVDEIEHPIIQSIEEKEMINEDENIIKQQEETVQNEIIVSQAEEKTIEEQSTEQQVVIEEGQQLNKVNNVENTQYDEEPQQSIKENDQIIQQDVKEMINEDENIIKQQEETVQKEIIVSQTEEKTIGEQPEQQVVIEESQQLNQVNNVENTQQEEEPQQPIKENDQMIQQEVIESPVEVVVQTHQEISSIQIIQEHQQQNKEQNIEQQSSHEEESTHQQQTQESEKPSLEIIQNSQITQNEQIAPLNEEQANTQQESIQESIEEANITIPKQQENEQIITQNIDSQEQEKNHIATSQISNAHLVESTLGNQIQEKNIETVSAQTDNTGNELEENETNQIPLNDEQVTNTKQPTPSKEIQEQTITEDNSNIDQTVDQQQNIQEIIEVQVKSNLLVDQENINSEVKEVEKVQLDQQDNETEIQQTSTNQIHEQHEQMEVENNQSEVLQQVQSSTENKLIQQQIDRVQTEDENKNNSNVINEQVLEIQRDVPEIEDSHLNQTIEEDKEDEAMEIETNIDAQSEGHDDIPENIEPNNVMDPQIHSTEVNKEASEECSQASNLQEVQDEQQSQISSDKQCNDQQNLEVTQNDNQQEINQEQEDQQQTVEKNDQEQIVEITSTEKSHSEQLSKEQPTQQIVDDRSIKSYVKLEEAQKLGSLMSGMDSFLKQKGFSMNKPMNESQIKGQSGANLLSSRLFSESVLKKEDSSQISHEEHLITKKVDMEDLLLNSSIKKQSIQISDLIGINNSVLSQMDKYLSEKSLKNDSLAKQQPIQNEEKITVGSVAKSVGEQNYSFGNNSENIFERIKRESDKKTQENGINLNSEQGNSLIITNVFTPSNAKIVSENGANQQTQFSNDSFGITPKRINFLQSNKKNEAELIVKDEEVQIQPTQLSSSMIRQSNQETKQKLESDEISSHSSLNQNSFISQNGSGTNSKIMQSSEIKLRTPFNNQAMQSFETEKDKKLTTKGPSSYTVISHRNNVLKSPVLTSQNNNNNKSYKSIRERSNSKSPGRNNGTQNNKAITLSVNHNNTLEKPRSKSPLRQAATSIPRSAMRDDLSISSVNMSRFDLEQDDDKYNQSNTTSDQQPKRIAIPADLSKVATTLGITKHNRNQCQLIDQIYNQDKNICKFMLNQSGKNILYQTMALLDDSLPNHFIVVVTNQFMTLRSKMNKLVSWACINSMMGVDILVQVQNLLMERKIKLLFIQQESLLQEQYKFMKDQIKMIIYEDQTDKINEINEIYNISRYHLLNTTGFKTLEQVNQICDRFSLTNIDENIVLYGFDFSNVNWTFESDKEKSFINFIRKNNLKKVIMFIDRSKKIEEVVSAFNQKGLKMQAFNSQKQEQISQNFAKDQFEILCCYNGQFVSRQIKQQVQYYIHYHLPRSVISYMNDMNGFQYYHIQKGFVYEKFSCGFLTENDFFEIRSAMVQDLTEKKLIQTVLKTINGNANEGTNNKKKAADSTQQDDFFFNVVLDETEIKIQEHYNNLMKDEDGYADMDAEFDANVKQIQITKFINENCIKREVLIKILSYIAADQVQIMPYQGVVKMIQKNQLANNKIVNTLLKNHQNKTTITFSILDLATELQMTSQELNRSLKKLNAEKKLQYEVKEEIALLTVKHNIDQIFEKLFEQIRFQEEKQINDLDTMYLCAKLTCNLTLEQVFKYQKYKDMNNNSSQNDEGVVSLKSLLEKYLNESKGNQMSDIFSFNDKLKLPFISLKSQREKSNLMKDIQNLVPRIQKSKLNLVDFQLNRDFAQMDFESQSRFVSLILQGIDGKHINEFKPALQFKKYFKYDYFDILSISFEYLQQHYTSLLQSETSKKIKI